MTGDQQKDGAVLASFATLSILQLIKDAQQKHGLRHGDYQRYRGYCERRVRRIRKSLGYSHLHRSAPKHPAKFVQRKITYDVISEERYLQVAIFDAERCWSYAMQLKQEGGEDPHSRKRFHMISRLRKAVTHSSNLESIVRQCDRADAVTKLESQAYNAWMQGYLAFELKQWKRTLEFLKTAKTIYAKLSDVVKIPELMELYKARIREIQPQIRYCEFNCGDDAAASDEAMSEMISMRLKLGGDEGNLQDDFDKLISEMRSRATMGSDQQVFWAKKTIVISNDAVKQLIQSLSDFDAQLAKTPSYDEKVELYERILGDIRDVIQSLNEEQKKASNVPADRTSTSQLLLAYLDFLRTTKAIDRYLMIISYTKSQTEKKTKPQDLLRLYDSVIENCKDILNSVDVQNDPSLMDAYKAKVEYYQAFRCYFMAEAYASLSKWEEAAALYDRALHRSQLAKETLEKIVDNEYVKEKVDDLSDLSSQINSSKFSSQASRLAEVAGNAVDEAEDVTSQYSQPLVENMDEYHRINPEDLKKPDSNICLIPLTPSFIPMPNKPMFFDLALNHVQMPDLEKKIASFGSLETSPGIRTKNNAKQDKVTEPEQQGLTGMMKGWFWGRK
ncbi:hypothetical protein AB6A40_007155 [Gnathostoma spinigerum]|uniref:Signal recognition particle subunit SRP68 n=1 Tax=Gnathostoma spinigerum TaxID=75299 RepID=A0ABD6EME0_9BILA